MSVKLYVGNLSYDVTEKHLEDLFNQHGEVSSVKIISDQYSGKSKGFAFVEMSDNTEANNAIKNLDGTSMMERSIKVNIAKPKNDAGRSFRY